MISLNHPSDMIVDGLERSCDNTLAYSYAYYLKVALHRVHDAIPSKYVL